jgi:phenylpropionate dioxygenase-like ring-hydroxylating dioxygenase large terminal subunit
MYLKDTNESLTRIGPGTPMSDLMRRFWIPALLEREVTEPSGERIELRLFGEDLVVGSDAQGRVKLASYPTLVRAGVVWTYMGPNEFTPQLPDFAWSALPHSRRYAQTHRSVQLGTRRRRRDRRRDGFDLLTAVLHHDAE